jgi:hypothetical protein
MIMVQALFPLIDGLTGLILAGIEVLKGYFGMKVTEYNIRIQQISDEEDLNKRPIGFIVEEKNE